LPARQLGQRSPLLVIIGLLCLTVGVGALVLSWQAVSRTTAVLVTTRAVTAGEVLQDADVKVAEVSFGGGMLAPLPANAPVSGQVALTQLAAGTILVAGMVGTTDPVSPGMVRMAVVVEIGRLPEGTLSLGQPISLCGPSGQVVAGAAATAPQLASDGLSYHFDVLVAEVDAVTVAGWVMGNQVIVAAL